MSVLEIEEKAMNLPDDEKIGLIMRLQKSLQSDDEEPPDWHGEVLAERQRQIDAGEAHYIPWEQVKAEMKQRRTSR